MESEATNIKGKAHYHLPGLFEFYDFYKAFLPLYRGHGEYFYDWCDIGSVYGAPEGCLWGGGRMGEGDPKPGDVLSLMAEYGISARLTFSNSLLRPEHFLDPRCNMLCALFEKAPSVKNGVIIHSDLLLNYLKDTYPGLYFVSSTTKVLTEFEKLREEIDRPEFAFVVPDFRLNKAYDKLGSLEGWEKDKVEFLCNECCWTGCTERKQCYENVSRCSLGEEAAEHVCKAPGHETGYKFSKAMQSPAFISVEDIMHRYLPMGFSHFKIEGRSLGSALLLEFILYYMTKPEYHIHVREELYLENTLDLF